MKYFADPHTLKTIAPYFGFTARSLYNQLYRHRKDPDFAKAFGTTSGYLTPIQKNLLVEEFGELLKEMK